MPSTSDFLIELRAHLREAELRGSPAPEANSGALHRKLGGYPGRLHQMRSCCQAMYNEERSGDDIVSAPPRGKGASLTIRHRLPR